MDLRTVLPFMVIFLTVPIYGLNHQFAVPGGVSDRDIPATQEVHDLVQSLNPKLGDRLVGLPGGKHVRGEFTPISYRTQVVNGINYFIKVGARTAQKMVYYHIKIYKPREGEPKLIKVVGPMRFNDSIGYF